MLLDSKFLKQSLFFVFRPLKGVDVCPIHSLRVPAACLVSVQARFPKMSNKPLIWLLLFAMSRLRSNIGFTLFFSVLFCFVLF